MGEALNVEKIFGEKVFTMEKMRERLTRKVFLEVKRVMDHGGELSMATADVVAKAMKDWAVENGATHFTHWFQPLTGITAEKHDSFVSHPDSEGKMLMEFSEKSLSRANRMHPHSRQEDCARRSRREATRRGTSLPRHF